MQRAIKWLLFIISINCFGQSQSLLQVQDNLARFNWEGSMYNETGEFENGTGTYDFNIASTKTGKRVLWFVTDAMDELNTGWWSVFEITSQKPERIFILRLSFNNALNSPIQPNAPLHFEIINPFKPEKMSLRLVPPPSKTRNRILFDKQI